MRIFEHPEIKNLFDELFEKLLEESGRGAILIATARAEDFLTDLINTVLPNEISRDDKRKIINGTFYSKIAYSYAFRLIDKQLSDSLNALRDVRNDAAHSSSKFELHELNEKMNKVYDLGPNIRAMINNMSTELIVGSKIISLNGIFDEANYTEERKKEELMEIFKSPEKQEIINKQLPYWELITGLCLICGMIVHKKDRIVELEKKMTTWDNLLPLIEKTYHNN
jgi:hypothetical protein